MAIEDQRLDRIENKLDKLTEAVTNIVRVEEKYMHQVNVLIDLNTDLMWVKQT